MAVAKKIEINDDGIIIEVTRDELRMIQASLAETDEAWDWEFPTRTGFEREDYVQLIEKFEEISKSL